MSRDLLYSLDDTFCKMFRVTFDCLYIFDGGLFKEVDHVDILIDFLEICVSSKHQIMSTIDFIAGKGPHNGSELHEDAVVKSCHTVVKDLVHLLPCLCVTLSTSTMELTF